MENVRSLVVGMIKQSVLKEVNVGGGGGGRKWVRAKFYIGERGDNNHCNYHIVLSFLLI